MTPAQRKAVIDAIRAKPRRLGLIDLTRATGAGLSLIHEVSDLLKRGQACGFLSYHDGGPGERGYEIASDWQEGARATG